MKATRLLMGMMLLVLASQLAFSIGISPATTRIDFQPGLEQNHKLLILNNGGPGSVGISVGGELAPYINLSSSQVEVTREDEQKPIWWTIKLPRTLEIGQQEATIRVVKKGITGGVGADLGVSHRVVVKVPPEFGRIVAKINGTPGTLFVQLTNPREEPAEDIYLGMDIKEAGKPLFKFSKRGISLSANTTTLLKIPLTFTREGSFNLNYSIIFQDEKIQYLMPLSLGSPSPEIEVKSTEFRAGMINPMDLLIQNNWNTNFTARVKLIVHKNNKLMGDTTSQNFLMPKYGITEQQVFLDASNLGKGDYMLILELWYGKNKATIRQPISLLPPAIEIKEPLGAGKLAAIVGGAILVILLALGTLYYVKFNKNI